MRVQYDADKDVLKGLSILTGDESLLDPNKFKREHDPSKTVFIMMKFQNGDSEKNEKLQTLYNTIQLELDKYGLAGCPKTKISIKREVN